MPQTRKNRGSRKNTTRSNRGAARSKSNPSPALTQAVNTIVARGSETKYVTETITSGIYFNSVITNPSDWYRCIPQLAQSTNSANSYTREGRVVQNCHLKFNWNFRYGNADASTRDIFVVLYVLQPKFQKASRRTDVNNQVSFFNSQYLDNGQGTMTSFAGTWATSKMPINKEAFTLLHKKVFRLSKASGSSNGSGVVGQYDGYGRGMYAIGHRDNISHTWSKKLPNLKYDDGTYSIATPDVAMVLPQNASPVWGVGYYYADGTAADTAGGILLVDSFAELHFKDM